MPMMSYQEATEYLFQQLPMFERNGAADYKPGLATIRQLDEWLDRPHSRFRSIHVAGTNGKGSVSHSIAAVLQQMGYNVGLFTSPHLVDFRERIRINGTPIPEEEVTDFVERYQKEWPVDGDMKPTFFELTTAMAFDYFARQQVQWAVIEVGLGGRLDSTNIIQPDLSVITNISLDHTQLLGNTLAEIASEKAGIIKRGVPVVIGKTQPETQPVFEAVARKNRAPIFFADQMRDEVNLYDSELKGEFQQENTLTATCAIHVLFNSFDDDALFDSYIKDALPQVCHLTGLRGRWETLQQKPLVICDIGHNPGAWQWLGPQVAGVKCRQRRIVFGMVGDKDVEAVMKMLPKDAVYYLTQPSCHRAKPVEELSEIAGRIGLDHRTVSQGATCLYHSVSDAYKDACDDASPDDFIFVGGSSYLVADLLTELNNNSRLTGHSTNR